MSYWKSYYNKEENVNSGNFHSNVGRTKSGQVISQEEWELTLQDISNILGLPNKTFRILELCCGNGQVIGNLASLCKKAVGVDFSKKLLNQLKSEFGNAVETIYADIMDVEFKPGSFNIIIIYFSIQHFSEQETIELVKRNLIWLRSGGLIYIGDVPDEHEKWNYINKPVHQIDYIQRAHSGKPKIGNWYRPEFFQALGNYFDNTVIEHFKQPSYHINSNYRFDVLIRKK